MFEGHHFSRHYTQQNHKIFRCVAYTKGCSAQILAFEKQVYVIDSMHNHYYYALADESILAKNTLK